MTAKCDIPFVLTLVHSIFTYFGLLMVCMCFTLRIQSCTAIASCSRYSLVLCPGKTGQVWKDKSPDHFETAAAMQIERVSVCSTPH